MPEVLCFVSGEFDFYFITDFVICQQRYTTWRNKEGFLFPSNDKVRPYASYYFRNRWSYDSDICSKLVKDTNGPWSTFTLRNLLDLLSQSLESEDYFSKSESHPLFGFRSINFSEYTFEFSPTWFSPLRSGPRITCPSMISSLY